MMTPACTSAADLQTDYKKVWRQEGGADQRQFWPGLV